MSRLSLSSLVESARRVPSRAWAFIVLAPFVLLWLGGAIFYALSPVYADHAESSVVVTTQQWLHGRPLYHAVNSPYLYDTFLYGPFSYLPLALMLTVIPDPILASKLAGTFTALATLVLLLFVFRRQGGLLVAIAALGLVAAELLTEPYAPFWVRPDPILIFSVSLGLAALALRQRMWGEIVLVVAIAIAFDCKIHGPVYLLPCLAVWWRREGWLSSFLVLFGALALGLALFLLPGISLGNYVALLRIASHRESLTILLRDCLELFLFLLVPLSLFAGQQAAVKGRRITEETALFIGAVIAGLLICVPASKWGAGKHHLLPMAVYVGWLFAHELGRSPRQLRLTWMAGLAAVWLLLAYLQAGYNFERLLDLRHEPGGKIQADLRQILRKYPAAEMQMGVGDSEDYSSTFYAPLLYRAGTQRVLEPAGYMDMKMAGFYANGLQKSLAAEQFRYWLIPRDNRPFTMVSFYDKQPLFDDAMRATFAQHYAKVDSSGYYDVYRARTGGP